MRPAVLLMFVLAGCGASSAHEEASDPSHGPVRLERHAEEEGEVHVLPQASADEDAVDPPPVEPPELAPLDGDPEEAP